jgi:DNA invertase Pin-like site-specific DNA recombinase
MLAGLQQRGKDKMKRKMNPKSLANLKPAKPFTTHDHPSKPRKLTDEQVAKAQELRSNGCSWRKVGDLLECNFQTVRSSLRRMKEKAANSTGNLKLLTGGKTASRRYPTLRGCSAR